MVSLPEDSKGIIERLMTWKVTLVKGRFHFLINAYAPTLDAEETTRNNFYVDLDTLLQNANKSSALLTVSMTLRIK